MFISPNVISIADVCAGKIREEILKSDYIRNETLKRCYAIPSYRGKSRKWKNLYYDLMKKRVMEELKIR